VDEIESGPACSLTPDELARGRDDLLPGLLRRAAEVTELEDGFRVRFDAGEGLLARVAAVLERERACCSFLRFRLTVEPEHGPVLLEVTGPAGTRELLRSLAP
jgi:hypothetical protein